MDQNREAQVVDETRHGRTVWDFLSGMQRRQTFLAVAVLAAAALILGALLVIVLSAEPGSQIEIPGDPQPGWSPHFAM